jgi:cellulose synthase/poly-beta-1,6-N-acetylglucosamine synthase-like glycosyltransferase
VIALLALKSLLVGLVFLGALPLLLADYQFLLVGWHSRRLHYADCRPYRPRVTVLVPAWNEAAVLGTAIDRLLQLDYPAGRLRIIVVDDASTDGTAEVAAAKVAEHPGRVVHLRREQGGQGKAAALNEGLAQVLADDWSQAVLIIDADVILGPRALHGLTRHLADPAVGSVTGYIREGSRPDNYLTRFIGYEYIVASAAARRSQNVLGVVACLAGGAQLHSRANIEAIGGRIDTGTLAEDTVTTFQTQLAGHRAIFEPHAAVSAEEPMAIAGLYRQRLRWARGNLQVTGRFRGVWFRPGTPGGLGGISFGLIWFSLLLLPMFLLCASASLVTLYFIDYQLALTAFRVLWLTSVLTYVFITSFALLIDPPVGRRTWREALLFPGLVNVLIMATAVAPAVLSLAGRWERGILLFTYVWLAACLAVAYLGKLAEPRWAGRITGPLFVYVGGYGPLLCAITCAAYLKELRHADARWEKTEKTGKAVSPV